MRTSAAALAIGCLLPALHAQPANGWKIEKIGQRDYLAVDQIQNYYGFVSQNRQGDTITLENPKIRMEIDVGTTRCRMNRIGFVFLEESREVENKTYVSRRDLSLVIDPVLRPRFIKNAGDFKTVILDPGHGGKDAGTVNHLGTEAGYTLKLATLTGDLLRSKGFKVVMTRNDDRDLLLKERVEIANAVTDEAVFISLSFNSGPKGERGIETSPLTRDDGEVNPFRSASMALACATHGKIIRKLGTNIQDRGIRQIRHSILASVRHPAIVVECGFMTHAFEARLIDNAQYQAALANAVAGGVEQYRSAVRSAPPEVIEKTPEEQ